MSPRDAYNEGFTLKDPLPLNVLYPPRGNTISSGCTRDCISTPSVSYNMRRYLRKRRDVEDDQRTTDSNVATLPVSNAKSGRRLKKKPYAYLKEWEMVQEFPSGLIELPPATQTNGDETAFLCRKKLIKPRKRRVAQAVQPPELPQPSQSLGIPITDEPTTIPTTPNAMQCDEATHELSQDIQPIPTLTENSSSNEFETIIPPDMSYQTQPVALVATAIHTPSSHVQPGSTPPLDTSNTSCSGHSSLVTVPETDPSETTKLESEASFTDVAVQTESQVNANERVSIEIGMMVMIMWALHEQEKRRVAVQPPKLPQCSHPSDVHISDEPLTIANTPATMSMPGDQATHEPPQGIQPMPTLSNKSGANGIMATNPPDMAYQTQSVAPAEPLSYLPTSSPYAGSASSEETSYCSDSGRSSLVIVWETDPSETSILESSTEVQPASGANTDESETVSIQRKNSLTRPESQESRVALGAVQSPKLKSANAPITPYDQDPPQYTPPTPALRDNANVNEIAASVPPYTPYETQPVAPLVAASFGSSPTSSPNVQPSSAPPEKMLANALLTKANETNSMEEEMDSQTSSLYCMTMSGFQAQERRRVALRLTELIKSLKQAKEEIESQTPLAEVQSATLANETVSMRNEQSPESEERRVAPSDVHSTALPQSLQWPGVPIADELTTPTTRSTAPNDQEPPQDTTPTTTLADKSSTIKITTTIPTDSPYQTQAVPPLATQNCTTKSRPSCPDRRPLPRPPCYTSSHTGYHRNNHITNVREASKYCTRTSPNSSSA